MIVWDSKDVSTSFLLSAVGTAIAYEVLAAWSLQSPSFEITLSYTAAARSAQMHEARVLSGMGIRLPRR